MLFLLLKTIFFQYSVTLLSHFGAIFHFFSIKMSAIGRIVVSASCREVFLKLSISLAFFLNEGEK